MNHRFYAKELVFRERLSKEQRVGAVGTPTDLEESMFGGQSEVSSLFCAKKRSRTSRK